MNNIPFGLPDNVVTLIFLKLDPVSLHICRQVCSDWNVFILEYIWKTFHGKKSLLKVLKCNWSLGNFFRTSTKLLTSYWEVRSILGMAFDHILVIGHSNVSYNKQIVLFSLKSPYDSKFIYTFRYPEYNYRAYASQDSILITEYYYRENVPIKVISLYSFNVVFSGKIGSISNIATSPHSPIFVFFTTSSVQLWKLQCCDHKETFVMVTSIKPDPPLIHFTQSSALNYNGKMLTFCHSSLEVNSEVDEAKDEFIQKVQVMAWSIVEDDSVELQENLKILDLCSASGSVFGFLSLPSQILALANVSDFKDYHKIENLIFTPSVLIIVCSKITSDDRNILDFDLFFPSTTHNFHMMILSPTGAILRSMQLCFPPNLLADWYLAKRVRIYSFLSECFQSNRVVIVTNLCNANTPFVYFHSFEFSTTCDGMDNFDQAYENIQASPIYDQGLRNHSNLRFHVTTSQFKVLASMRNGRIVSIDNLNYWI